MKKPKLILSLALLSAPLALFSGCGKKKDEAPPVAVAAAVATSCSAGQVLSSQYGCLSPWQNQPGYGNYNNQAVPASCWSGTVMTSQGCQAQNANIPSQPNQNPYPNGSYSYGMWVWTYHGWYFVRYY